MKKRVKIPTRDAKALLDLANKVREKHLTDGDASPLKILNWDNIIPAIDEAVKTDEMALKLKREKLKMYQQRARRLDAVANIMRNSRDILTAVYSDEMKALGTWGFDVLDNRSTDADVETSTPVKS